MNDATFLGNPIKILDHDLIINYNTWWQSIINCSSMDPNPRTFFGFWIYGIVMCILGMPSLMVTMFFPIFKKKTPKKRYYY